MKVREAKPEFEPKEIRITFDSQKEIDAFYSVFNFTSITRILESGDVDCDSIREILPHSGEYQTYHDKLCKITI